MCVILLLVGLGLSGRFSANPLDSAGSSTASMGMFNKGSSGSRGKGFSRGGRAVPAIKVQTETVAKEKEGSQEQQHLHANTAIVTLATGDQAARLAISLVQSLRDVETKIPNVIVMLSRGGVGSADCQVRGSGGGQSSTGEPEEGMEWGSNAWPSVRGAAGRTLRPCSSDQDVCLSLCLDMGPQLSY